MQSIVRTGQITDETMDDGSILTRLLRERQFLQALEGLAMRRDISCRHMAIYSDLASIFKLQGRDFKVQPRTKPNGARYNQTLNTRAVGLAGPTR